MHWVIISIIIISLVFVEEKSLMKFIYLLLLLSLSEL